MKNIVVVAGTYLRSPHAVEQPAAIEVEKHGHFQTEKAELEEELKRLDVSREPQFE